MYVPRPKRASYGNEQPRSRHNSSSRTSLDSSDEKTESIVEKKEVESRLCETNATILSESCELLSQNELPATPQVDSVNENNQLHNSSINLESMTSKDCDDRSTVLPAETSTGNPIPSIPAAEEISNRLGSQLDEAPSKNGCLDGESHSEMEVDSCDCNSKVTNSYRSSSTEENCLSNNNKNGDLCKDNLIESSNETNSLEVIPNADKRESYARKELTCPKSEHMETISISSESTGSGSDGITSSSCSKSNSSSSDSENVKSHYKHSRDDKIDTETSSSSSDDKERTNNGSCTNNSKQKKSTVSALPVSDVLVISDTSSSSDSVLVSKSEKKTESKIKDVKKPKVPNRSKREKHMKKSRVVQPEECDWESLYDDSGECLVPSLMEEVSQPFILFI